MGAGRILLRLHDLLSSRLYCRPRNFTESCLAARGLYHRWGITPRPEDPDLIEESIRRRQWIVNPPLDNIVIYLGRASDHACFAAVIPESLRPQEKSRGHAPEKCYRGVERTDWPALSIPPEMS